MAIPSTYVGFSSVGVTSTNNVTLYDVELVKRDLMNHFMTRVGERVMRPDFGCRIWDYLYENGTADITDLIVADAQRVCKSDPRVILRQTNVYFLENGIQVEMLLDFIGLAVMQTFAVLFEIEERLAYGQPV